MMGWRVPAAGCPRAGVTDIGCLQCPCAAPPRACSCSARRNVFGTQQKGCAPSLRVRGHGAAGRSRGGPVTPPHRRPRCTAAGAQQMGPDQYGGIQLVGRLDHDAGDAPELEGAVQHQESPHGRDRGVPEGAHVPLTSADAAERVDELLYSRATGEDAPPGQWGWDALDSAAGREADGAWDVAPHYVGPLEVQEVPGVGVGLFCTEDVAAGQLLMACRPLAQLRAAPHMSPSAVPPQEQLVSALFAAPLSPLAATWLRCMWGAEGAGGLAGRQRAKVLRQLLGQPLLPVQLPQDLPGGGGAPSASCSIGSVSVPLSAEGLSRVVALNAASTGRVAEDPAVRAIRSGCWQRGVGEADSPPQQRTGLGSGGRAAVGLWPAFSLLNHSCAPNASFMVVAGVMAVRAAVDLQKGEEVTVSYLGAKHVLLPRPQRAELLAQRFMVLGCCCPRCRLEGAQLSGSETGSLSPGPHAEQQRLGPRIRTYVDMLHGTCARMAAPHLQDLLSGRRWVTPGDVPSAPQQRQQPWGGEEAQPAGASGNAAGAGAGPGGSQGSDAPVSELLDELHEIRRHLGSSWQNLLGALAEPTEEGAGGDGVGGRALAGDAGSSCVTQQQVLWVEGSIFVLFELLAVAVGALGLVIVAAASAAGQRAAAGEAAAHPPRKHVRDSGSQKKVPEVGGWQGTAPELGGGGLACISAAEALRAVQGQQWSAAQLPGDGTRHEWLDILAHCGEVAAAVIPGSELAVALAVRLAMSVRQACGEESEQFREAELRAYDAHVSRYGMLDYDVYEAVLHANCERLGGEAAGSVQLLPGGWGVGVGDEAGLVGLIRHVHEVEAEVVIGS